MMLASPFFDGYDSDPYYSYHQPTYRRQRPSSYNHQQQRYLQQLRAAREAQLRRAETERRLERAARQEYLQRLQEEEAHRRAYEAAKRRRELEEERQVQRYLFGNDGNESGMDEEEEDLLQPVFRVLQGPDGRLYKVKVGEKTRSQPEPEQRQSKSRNRPAEGAPRLDDTYQLVRGPDGRIYRVQLQSPQEVSEKRPMPSWFSRANHDDCGDDEGIDNVEDNDERESSGVTTENFAVPLTSKRIPIRPMGRQRSNGKRKVKKTVTVMVEDASDSESEDDFQSVWRNRRPSPGQWMEPVQST